MLSECSCKSKTVSDYSAVVTEHCELTDKITWITFECPKLACELYPGQSVMLFLNNVSDPMLGRPFSVAYTDPGKSTLSLCYIQVGKGTALMKANLKIGDRVTLRGPFGIRLPENENKKIYLLTGGVGAAIFMKYASLHCGGGKCEYYVGMAGKGTEKYAQKIQSIVPSAHIFADDGSFGEGASMFDKLPKALGENELIWACGPDGFINAVKRIYNAQLDKIWISIDKTMACGYGGCMGCVVNTKNGLKRICVDQSLFRADEVIEDE